MSNKPRVSIICNAYNHERYIEYALKGFVSQRTNFPYEVLIHDDASTDGTAEIIKKYEKMYPDIIKPIYQSENQYSKGVRITSCIQVCRAQGDYIAICEGDDYWIDEQKLQKQFDIMEKHSEINMCAHAAYVETDGEKTGISKPSSNVRIYRTEEVIINDGDFFATASLFVRKKVFESSLETANKYSIDYSWQLLGSLEGGILFLPDIMSVYRLYACGSWTSKMAKNKNALALHYDRIITMLDVFDKDTEFKFSHIISFQKATYLFNKGYATSNKKIIKEAKKILCSRSYKDCYALYYPSIRLRKYIKFHFDWIYKFNRVYSNIL